MANGFYVGKRLSYNGDLCTVRYVGPVEGTKGDWLGVEWDDPSRGKHSGQHGGIKYFECRSKSPIAASFVRPTRAHDTPRTFVEALRHKYAADGLVDDAATATGPAGVPITVIGEVPDSLKAHFEHKPIRISGKEVEEVGFDKISRQLANLHELRIVILDELRVARPNRDGRNDIAETCPKITELDLSRNLFEDWREIVSICAQLKQLKNLRIDGNRFREVTLTEDEKTEARSAFAGITHLSLSETLLAWEHVTSLASLFPDLTTLDISRNLYSQLTDHVLPATLKEVHLESNDLRTLSDLESLTQLPCLRLLILKNNAISTVTAAPSTAPPRFPPSLAELDLSYNEVGDWSFIDALPTVFPGLLDLRIAHNPLYQALRVEDGSGSGGGGRPLSADDGYTLTLARLGRLRTLNHSAITPKDRLNAEAYYLALIARELAARPAADAPAVLARHPRYQELCAEYGEPVVVRRPGDADPHHALAARLLRCRFRLGASVRRAREGRPAADEDGDGGVWVQEVPRAWTVYAVLGLVARRWTLRPLELKLVWETGSMAQEEERGAGVKKDDETEDDESEYDSYSDSDSDSGSVGEHEERKGDRIREVELLAGTRPVGTWIDGNEADLRVELA